VFFLAGDSKRLLETITNTNTGNWSNKKHKLCNQRAEKHAIIPQKIHSNHWLYAGQNKVKTF
jgi:hypothetical protein